MKALLIISSIILSINISFAQVGVFTERPFGILHIDGKANNTVDELPEELLDDVIVVSDGSGGVNIGIGDQPYISAQLDLQDSTKAMYINRVALKSPEDIETVANPKEGMLVYNTVFSGTSIVPGFYLHDGTSWNLLQTDVDLGLSTLNLKENATTVVSNGSTTVTNGVPLALGTQDEGGNYSVVIPETGSYAFDFRLNGLTPYREPLTNVYYYLAVLRNGSLVDLAEMDILIGDLPNDGSVVEEPLSYNITMGCQATVGDKITFRMSHYTSTLFNWTLLGEDTANNLSKTVMTFWKL